MSMATDADTRASGSPEDYFKSFKVFELKRICGITGLLADEEHKSIIKGNSCCLYRRYTAVYTSISTYSVYTRGTDPPAVFDSGRDAIHI